MNTNSTTTNTNTNTNSNNTSSIRAFIARNLRAGSLIQKREYVTYYMQEGEAEVEVFETNVPGLYWIESNNGDVMFELNIDLSLYETPKTMYIGESAVSDMLA